MAPTEEAVDACTGGWPRTTRRSCRTWRSALSNLGIRYSEVGRRAEAVAPTEEAVNAYRGLAADNPAFLPDLAGALNNLGDAVREVGRDPQAPWEQALTGQTGEPRAILQGYRAAAADPGHPDAAAWLARRPRPGHRARPDP